MATLALKYTHVEPGESGAIWQSGTAPTVLNGDLYFSTANGPFNPAPGGNDYGDSIIRLTTSASAALSQGLPTNLNVRDYFTPSNQQYLSDADQDEGSTGAMAIANGQYVISVGKIGTLFLLNATRLGGYVPPTGTPGPAPQSPNAVQVIPNAVGGTNSGPGLYGSPAWWAAGTGALFFRGNGDVLRKYPFTSAGNFDTTKVLTASNNPAYVYPGASTILSGATPTSANAIVWDLDAATNLYAYAASNLALLWSGSGQSHGCGSNPTKFVVPIVAAGKACHGCSNGMVCYSLL